MKLHATILFVLTTSAAMSGAQTNKSAPDAVIMVQPYGETASIAAVYSGVESHARAQKRIRDLARITGWNLVSSSVQDRTIDIQAPKNWAGESALGKGGGPGKQTESTAFFTRAPQILSNGFILRPYVQAFSDLNRFELMVVYPADPGFRGLRNFDSSALSVHLTNSGGPYRYVVNVKNHASPIPEIPLTESVASPNSGRAGQSLAGNPPARAKQERDNLVWIILLLSVGSAFVVFVLLRIWARAKSVPQVRAGRMQ